MFKLLDNLKMLIGVKSDTKTLKLLEAASSTPNSCVVCANSVDARHLVSIINEHNWDITVMTFNQFINKEFKSTNIKAFYFADVDKMFKGLVHPKKIKMLSFNTDNIEYVKNDEE